MSLVKSRSALAVIIGTLYVTSAYAADTELNNVQHGLTTLGGSVYQQHQALVLVGNDLAEINKTDEKQASEIQMQQHFIARNAVNIAGNKTDIAKNTADIAKNSTAIDKQTTETKMQQHFIARNAVNIAGNKTDIAKNTADIAKNSTAIDKQTTETKMQQHFIARNAVNIADNKAGIDRNTSDIAEQVHTNETQQHAITKNSEEIIATQKTLSSVGDTQNAARYQGMINAKHEAEQLATQQEINTLAKSVPVAMVSNNSEVKANSDAIKLNHDAVKHVADAQTEERIRYETQIHTLADDAATAINSDRRQIISTQQRVDSNAAQLSKLNSNFSSLKHTVDENKHEAAAGSSSAMAQANIPQVLNGQTVAVGAGVGGYDGESAIAVGVSFRAADSVTVKATVSDDSQQNVGYGAGVSVGW